MAIEQRGTITRGFLFADLRGYTDFVERRGAAAAAELLTRYRALARDAIGQFGGAEIKTEGDSFYVVFDSVSSAVRCGLAIAADAQSKPDEPIPIGIGIHAGETIETDGGFVGSPVNIAARICAQAGAGEVLVSETVRALTATVLPVRFRSRGRPQLKGIADPIELFVVDEVPDGTTTWPSSARRRRLTRRGRVVLAGGVVIVLAAAAGLGWLVSRPSTGLPSGKWAIGVDVPTSGTGARFGIPLRNAVQLAVDQANAAGRLAGVELVAKAYDTGHGDREDPDKGAAAARTMAADPRTIAAVGPFTSPTAGAMIPITNRAGLLDCSPSTTWGGLTRPDDGALKLRSAYPGRINFVRLSPYDAVLSRALASFATHDLGAESALVINAPGWEGDADDIAAALAALGGQVMRSKLRSRKDVTAALKPLLRANPPDVVVFVGGTYDGAAEVRRAMSAAGLRSIPLLSPGDIVEEGSGSQDGSYLQQAGDAGAGTYAGLTSSPPSRADFVDAYRAAFGEEPTDNAAAAYACTQVVVASLQAVAEDGPTAKDLRDVVRAHAVDPVNRYETAIGTVGFDENGDSTTQMVSFFRVDPEAAAGAGDWVLIKQQDFGTQLS